MAVVTPDGIVGKVVNAYPTASLVMLITDPTFAAGVISQKNRVRGTLKGQGHSECFIDYVQNEEKVDGGEWFFTSGDDRIFPKGFPVGQVSAVRNGKTFKEIYLVPSGFQGGGVEEVLVLLQGVHQQIPDGESPATGYKILQSPPDSVADSPQPAAPPPALATDADRLREQYKQAGAEQKHVFGEGLPGSKPPDFTKIPGIRGASPLKNPPPAAAAAKPNVRPNPNAAASGQKPASPEAASANDASDAASNAAPKPKPQAAPALAPDASDAEVAPDATPPPKSEKAPSTPKPVTGPGGATPTAPTPKPPVVRNPPGNP
jgi:rod shape-determining protein MreC